MSQESVGNILFDVWSTFHKYTEDHQDFLNGFFADLSVHLKTVANKRFKNRGADAEKLDDLDDDLSSLAETSAKH